MLQAQAEAFARRDLVGEAVARAKQVLAYAELEQARSREDPWLSEQFEMRRLLAEGLMRRFGKVVRDESGDWKVDASDAVHPKSWA